MGTVVELRGGTRPPGRAGAAGLLDRVGGLIEGAAGMERDGNVVGALNDYAIASGAIYALSSLGLVPAGHPERDLLVGLGGAASGGLRRAKRRVKALVRGDAPPDGADEAFDDDDEGEDDG